MTIYKNWELIVKDHVANITLTRAETNNDLSITTLMELRELADAISQDDQIWVGIMQGQGAHFSSGMELQVFLERLNSPGSDLAEFIRTQQRCLDAWQALQVATIAKIRGFCIGGGLLLALCCDFRIASTRTIFSLPEIRLGIPPLWGTQRLVQLVGIAKAKEIVMLGKRYRAKEALEMGLLHQVTSEGELDNSVNKFAERFTHLPPRTAGLTKRIIDQSLQQTLLDSQEQEIAALESLLGSPDLKEAIQCYLENRSPHFTGK